MEALHTDRHNVVGIADPTLGTPNSNLSTNQSKGSLAQDAALEQSLNDSLAPDERIALPANPNDHDHAPVVGNFQFHVPLSQVASARGLDVTKLTREDSFKDNLGAKGRLLKPQRRQQRCDWVW